MIPVAVLPDDKVGRFHRVVNKISEQLGVSLSYDQTMVALTAILGGTISEIPTLIGEEPQFVEWVTLQLVEQHVRSIILTPANFGFIQPPATAEFIDPVWLAWWSREHANRLPTGYGIGLYAKENCDEIHEQTKSSLTNEAVWIAINLSACGELSSYMNVLEPHPLKSKTRMNRSVWVRPETRWNIDTKFLFSLVKITD
jgi:hypothetical protein